MTTVRTRQAGRIVAISAAPLLFMGAQIWTLVSLPPFWRQLADPVYQYLLNGVAITSGVEPGHTDHPGTSMQWLMGAVQWLTFQLSGQGGGFAASRSTFAGTQILKTTPLAVLRMPDRFVVGTQANLAVLINPANGVGSATFNVNNVQIYPSTTNVTGEVLFPWTPERSTQDTFVIDYSNRSGNAARQIRQPTFAFTN